MDWELHEDENTAANTFDGETCSIHPKWGIEKITDCPECFPHDDIPSDYVRDERDEEDGPFWDDWQEFAKRA